jgi:hypothetical protein
MLAIPAMVDSLPQGAIGQLQRKIRRHGWYSLPDTYCPTPPQSMHPCYVGVARTQRLPKDLHLLALPRGIEPMFSP